MSANKPQPSTLWNRVLAEPVLGRDAEKAIQEMAKATQQSKPPTDRHFIQTGANYEIVEVAHKTDSRLVNLAYNRTTGWNINALQRIIAVGNPTDKKAALEVLQQVAVQKPEFPAKVPKVPVLREETVGGVKGKFAVTYLPQDQRGSAISALGNVARGTGSQAYQAKLELHRLAHKGKPGKAYDELYGKKGRDGVRRGGVEGYKSGSEYEGSSGVLVFNKGKDTVAITYRGFSDRVNLETMLDKRVGRDHVSKRADSEKHASSRSSRAPSHRNDHRGRTAPMLPSTPLNMENKEI